MSPGQNVVAGEFREEIAQPRKANQYYRPLEEPFTEDQRATTTILAGSITAKHEALIEAVFQGEGYRFQALPTPTNKGFQVGKEFCNNGLCNPYYYTTGNLIQFLRNLKEAGWSRERISESFVYFAMGGCGPCRFGMYESEYRRALQNAGLEGLRVITFKSDSPIREGCKHPGLHFTADLTLGIVNALILGDLLYTLAYQTRPYEIERGETNKAVQECLAELSDFLRIRPRFEISESSPAWLFRSLLWTGSGRNLLNKVGKYREHFHSKDYADVLAACSKRLNQIEVDFTRPKAIVKIVGEFFSEIQEGEANYNAFSFLEQEGAEVAVDSTVGLLQYWLYYYQLQCQSGRNPELPCENPAWWQLRKKLANQIAALQRPLLAQASIRLLDYQFHRIARRLGGLARPLPKQKELARIAKPFFDPLVEGGEGHLEVAKSIYYTTNHLCHMVLALKPFGCMPSTQSDGVMAGVSSRIDGMLFHSLETSGEGEVNAHSRIQMALGEAQRRARGEFERALESTGKRIEDIQDYVSCHRELRSPFYRFPRRPGIAGVAANFIQHVSDLMDGRNSFRRNLA
jgi:predicted nucleotide-binding protein (sugar kinase/HSP70/actin superfamily)